MATLVLGAAGAALGGTVGGSLAGLAAPAIGRAVGAMAGGLLDQQLLGGGSQVVEGSRLPALRLQGSRDGTPLPRVFGGMRVTGTVIWASRFRETVHSTNRGGKGSSTSVKTREYRYSVSLAVALCTGPIDRIGRIWADGTELSPDTLPLRLHHGSEDADADPLIAALEPHAPAFRGTAYIVLEDLPLGRWNNRVPQFSVEVFREPNEKPPLASRLAPSLRETVRAVALSPGSGEFCLDTEPVLRRLGAGESQWENMNGLESRPDLLLSLDQLAEALPACRSVLLVVSWFGNDLRCGRCDIYPATETVEKSTEPVSWCVSGVSREAARVVGQTPEGRPVFGGTPADRSVIACIRELRARGYEIVFYPFILMDVPANNALEDPYGGGLQPAYPWRGRITLDKAPGVDGSKDKTAAARGEVAAFVGAASPDDFTPGHETVHYSGPEEWSFRRMVLHYAHLCTLAGGVDAFCIGSELRGLTQIRDGAATYPFVAALKALAGDVVTVLGSETVVGYAADWSEYFGHHPQDGSGDVIFHLDPLWSDPAIDFIGIDNYMPLSDWREGVEHVDALEHASPHELSYLQASIEGGEGYDWYYATDADRVAQNRTPITDGAAGEPWVFRYKDLKHWWSQPHYNRHSGVRAVQPTAWVPQSKPIWFTELGCPAIDKGANQPNVFLDAKSSESAAPYFSSGAPDGYAQRRYLQAVLDYWSTPGRNPLSTVYGGPMLALDRTHVWTWDARRWPDFPRREETWADGPNHRTGHWLTGRVGCAGLAETVAEICAEAGLRAVDVDHLHGFVEGYVIDRVQSARASLEPLMLAFDFDAVDSGDVLRFVPRGARPVATLTPDCLVAPQTGVAPTVTRGALDDSPARLRLSFHDRDADYRVASVDTDEADRPRLDTSELPLAMSAETAGDILHRWRADVAAAREQVCFSLPQAWLGLEPGDAVRLVLPEGERTVRIDRLTRRAAIEIEATRIETRSVLPRPVPRPATAMPASPPTPPLTLLLDLPSIDERAPVHWPRIAVHALPWRGPMAVYSARRDDGYALLTEVTAPATMGVVSAPTDAVRPWSWHRGTLLVDLFHGRLDSAAEDDVLNGANLAAVETEDGQWEVLQFCTAQLVGPRRWALTDLLRGQAGTERLAAMPIGAGTRFVLLDEAVVPVSTPVAHLGSERHFRVVPAHLGLEDPACVHFVTNATGRGLVPPAPVHGKVQTVYGGFAVTWVRRSRLDPDTWLGTEAPLGEDAERYRVTVMAGGTALRTQMLELPSFFYDQDLYAADSLTGPVSLLIAQLSAMGGAGPELEIPIDD